MSLFEDDDTEKLKQHRRFQEYQREQELAGFKQEVEANEKDHDECAEAEHDDVWQKFAELEKKIAGLGKQLEELRGWL